MSWIIGILTFILVVDCVFLILLILVQLPKKEAGLGTAFGSGATDALFGAGTGNALTKITKYCTVAFFVLTLSLSMLQAKQNRDKQGVLEQELQNLQKSELMETPAPATTPPAPAVTAAPATNTALNTLITTVSNAAASTAAAVTNAVTPVPAPAPAPAPATPEPPK